MALIPNHSLGDVLANAGAFMLGTVAIVAKAFFVIGCYAVATIATLYACLWLIHSMPRF